MLFNKQLDKTLRVCPHCGHHFRISARMRIDQLVDPGSFVERDADLTPVDSLGSWISSRIPIACWPPSSPPACGTPRCGGSARLAGSRSRSA